MRTLILAALAVIGLATAGLARAVVINPGDSVVVPAIPTVYMVDRPIDEPRGVLFDDNYIFQIDAALFGDGTPTLNVLLIAIQSPSSSSQIS